MWARDIFFAVIWAAAKGFSGFVFAGCVYSMWKMTGGYTPDVIVESRPGIFFAALLVGVIAFWVFHNLTDFPLLFWRRRKFHVLRILENNAGDRALQIRLFGIWFYVLFEDGDVEPHLALIGWTDLHRLYCWVGFSQSTMQKECGILIDRIRPPQTSVENCSTLIFENYTRKSDS